MTEQTANNQRGISPLLPLAKFPALVAGCAIGGLALGVATGALAPTTYTAETRLAVGSGQLSNLVIPGYPTASADMASNYARWVTVEGAGGQLIGDDSVNLSASPIPDSNVILLEAESQDAHRAISAADEAAQALTEEVNRVRETDNPEYVLDQIAENAVRLGEAEQRRNLAADVYRNTLDRVEAGEITEADTVDARERHSAAEQEYRTAEAIQTGLLSRYNRLVSNETDEADLSVVQPAQIRDDSSSSAMQRFGLAGLALGGLLGFVLAHVAYRRRRGPNDATQHSDAAVDSATAQHRNTEIGEAERL